MGPCVRRKPHGSKDWLKPRQRGAGASGPKGAIHNLRPNGTIHHLGPNGTIHKSPARSAWGVGMPFPVLQGRIMLGNAVGILADSKPSPGRSRMKRPVGTLDCRRDYPALRAGLL
jgi:hypothetical protein